MKVASQQSLQSSLPLPFLSVPPRGICVPVSLSPSLPRSTTAHGHPENFVLNPKKLFSVSVYVCVHVHALCVSFCHTPLNPLHL